MVMLRTAEKRLMRLRSTLKEKGVSRALFFNSSEHPSPHFFYLTGVKDVNACLVIDESVRLFVSTLELSIAQRHSFVKDVRELDASFKELLKGTKESVGVDFSYLSHARTLDLQKKGLHLVDVAPFVEEMRMYKDEEEVDVIKKACVITASIYDALVQHMKKLKTEKACRQFVLAEMLARDVTPSFPPIIASGNNSVNIHHQPEEHRLSGPTIVDMGVVYKGYCSDMTRTFFVGKKDRKQTELFQRVLVVQEQCRAMVQGGEDYLAIHQYAFTTLGKEMVHTVGHGLGIQVHEPPFIRKEPVVLKQGMVVTIEPGLYLKGIGGVRIEDDVWVTKKGSCLLSRYPREIVFV